MDQACRKRGLLSLSVRGALPPQRAKDVSRLSIPLQNLWLCSAGQSYLPASFDGSWSDVYHDNLQRPSRLPACVAARLRRREYARELGNVAGAPREQLPNLY